MAKAIGGTNASMGPTLSRPRMPMPCPSWITNTSTPNPTKAESSVVIAVKAALTTLLSAFVGFGVLVFVIQLGHGMGILGLDKVGPIEAFVPPIAFAILFGLSMDYEVFLMSRVREEHVRGKPTKLALTDGIAGVGRVIIAAALIMSSVFF